MNFNLVGSLLAVSSKRGTVHVFRLGSGQGGEKGGVKAVGAGASPSPNPNAVGGARGWHSARRRVRVFRAYHFIYLLRSLTHMGVSSSGV